MRNEQNIVCAAFRERYEDVIRCEAVSELSGRATHIHKARTLVLTRPNVSKAGASTDKQAAAQSALYLVRVDGPNRRVKLKRSFLLPALVSISHEGNFDASFDFGASGVLVCSFETPDQREDFLTAVRRITAALHSTATRKTQASARLPGGSVDGNATGVCGVLTETVALAAEMDATSRMRRLRPQTRRVFFSAAEELCVLRAMQCPAGQQQQQQQQQQPYYPPLLDDVRQLQHVLLRQQKESELGLVNFLVAADAMWDTAREKIQGLIERIAEVEGRIDLYSRHLLAHKDIIQQIEHDNNSLQRKEENLEELQTTLDDLRRQLRLDPETESLIHKLETVCEDGLYVFFAQDDHARVLSSAMRQMQSVLHSTQLAKEFPIAAVAERRAYFVQLRRMITRRAKSYLLATIGEYERSYLACRSRYSHQGYLVWRLHDELHARLAAVRDITAALARIDVEGYTAILRRYRTGMQRVHAQEIRRFHKYLRHHIRTTDATHVPFVLASSRRYGGAENAPDAEGCCAIYIHDRLAGGVVSPLCRDGSSLRACSPRAESEAGGAAAFRANDISSSSSSRHTNRNDDNNNMYRSASTCSCASPTTSLSPSHLYHDLVDRVHSRRRCTERQTRLEVEFPYSHVLTNSIDLYLTHDIVGPHNSPGCHSDRTSCSPAPSAPLLSRSRALPSRLRAALAGLRCGVPVNEVGCVRADLGFAVALQSLLTVILHEEWVLRYCFVMEGDDADDDPNRTSNSRLNENRVAVYAGRSLVGSGRVTRKELAEFSQTDLANDTEQRRALFLESLMELFGDESTKAVLVKQTQGQEIRPLSPSFAASLSTVQPHDAAPPSCHTPSDVPATWRDHVHEPLFHSAAPSTCVTPDATPTDALAFAASTSLTPTPPRIHSHPSHSAPSPPHMETAESAEAHAISLIAMSDAIQELVALTRFIASRCDPIVSVLALTLIRQYRDSTDLPTSHSLFCRALLGELHAVMTALSRRFIAEQTMFLTRCRNKYFVKPTPLLHCFANLPAFFALLEEMFAPLRACRCDRAHYAAVASSIVRQCVAALEFVSDGKHAGEAARHSGMLTGKIFLRKLGRLLDGSGVPSSSSWKQRVIQQYRHYAFFCAFYDSLAEGSYLRELLRAGATLSRQRRDRQAELYVTRVLFLHDFPSFGPLALSAEGLRLICAEEELQHHRALSVESVRAVVDTLPCELRSGICASARRAKRHFLRDVSRHSENRTFFVTLLECVWQKFAALVQSTLDLLHQLIRSNSIYRDITPTVSSQEVEDMLAAV